VTTTEEFHKDDELDAEQLAMCEAGTALSVKISRLAETDQGLGMVVEISSHIHTSREAKGVLAALDSAKDELEMDLALNSLPEPLATLLESLFDKFMSERGQRDEEESDHG